MGLYEVGKHRKDDTSDGNVNIQKATELLAQAMN